MNNNNQNPADVQAVNVNPQGINVDATANVAGATIPPQVQQVGINNNPYINNQIPVNQGINNNPYINQQNAVDNAANAGSGFNNGDFIKGALIGAGVAFLLTNKTTQQAIFGGISKGSELVQAGIEEIKERMEDAKAQMETKEF